MLPQPMTAKDRFRMQYSFFRKMMNSGRNRSSWLRGWLYPYDKSHAELRMAAACAWANSQIA